MTHLGPLFMTRSVWAGPGKGVVSPGAPHGARRCRALVSFVLGEGGPIPSPATAFRSLVVAVSDLSYGGQAAASSRSTTDVLWLRTQTEFAPKAIDSGDERSMSLAESRRFADASTRLTVAPESAVQTESVLKARFVPPYCPVCTESP